MLAGGVQGVFASSPEEQEGLKLLQGLVVNCLDINKHNQMHAYQLSAKLFDFMKAKSWSNCVIGDS